MIAVTNNLVVNCVIANCCSCWNCACVCYIISAVLNFAICCCTCCNKCLCFTCVAKSCYSDRRCCENRFSLCDCYGDRLIASYVIVVWFFTLYHPIYTVCISICSCRNSCYVVYSVKAVFHCTACCCARCNECLFITVIYKVCNRCRSCCNYRVCLFNFERGKRKSINCDIVITLLNMKANNIQTCLYRLCTISKTNITNGKCSHTLLIGCNDYRLFSSVIYKF